MRSPFGFSTFIGPLRSQRLVAARSAAAALCTALALLSLAACGGGSGDKSSSVTNVSANNLRYGSNLNVIVNGSGLDQPALTMTVVGPCGAVSRATASDSQVVFTCPLTGTGELEAQIRNGDGLLLGRVKASVPTPQVTMAVRQGERSGSLVIELDAVAAPLSVRNFLDYVNAGFYANTLFHRVINGTLAQGGGYTTGPTLKPNTVAAIALESNRGLANVRGSIAMARTSVPDSATSEFYFNLIDNPEFDYVSAEQPGYAVFGRVVTGLDVMDEIGKVAVQSRGLFEAVPVSEVRITAAVQSR